MPLSEQLVLICTPHVLDECAAEPSSWILKCSAGKSTRVSTMLDVTTTVPHVWVGNLNRFPFLPNDRFTLFFTSTANLRMMLILSPPLTGKHCHKPLAYWKSPYWENILSWKTWFIFIFSAFFSSLQLLISVKLFQTLWNDLGESPQRLR